MINEERLKKKLYEEIFIWLKKAENYPEQGNSKLEFKECSYPNMVGQFRFEDILKSGKALISLNVKASYWYKYEDGTKTNSHFYEWTINHIAILWIDDDYELSFVDITHYYVKL